MGKVKSQLIDRTENPELDWMEEYAREFTVLGRINEPSDVFNVPPVPENLDLELEGIEEVETFFCDKTGRDKSGRSLSPDRLLEEVREALSNHGTLRGAITDEGQFQLHITLYKEVA